MLNKIQKIYTAKHHNIFHYSFCNFVKMQEYGKNWTFYDQYRFGTQAFGGTFDIYQHKKFQIANAVYYDGLMYKGYAPKGTLTLMVVLKKEGSLTGNRKILQNNQILIVADKSEYEISFSHHVELGFISLTHSFIDTYCPYLYQLENKVFTDTNHVLGNMIQELKIELNIEDERVQSILIQNINSLSLEREQEILQKLSKKEKIIFDIRNYIIEHANEKLTIEELARKFKMSEKTMQTAFKKLFGYTPKKFLKLLKFNLAYQDLVKCDETTTIGEIITKYEFTNFGLFSREFKEIFGLLPSEVKKKGGGRCNLV